MKCSIILLLMMRLSQVKTGNVSISVFESDCRLEWCSSSPQIRSSIREKGIVSSSRIDRGRSSLCWCWVTHLALKSGPRMAKLHGARMTKLHRVVDREIVRTQDRSAEVRTLGGLPGGRVVERVNVNHSRTYDCIW
jgi:hypothetical protein